MLSYRSLDISVLRRALRRWRPDLQLPEAPSSHRAFDDLAHAIEIARIHRDVLRQGLVRRS
jgi:oligoribonuclease (3'-5' exoribonuclease)